MAATVQNQTPEAQPKVNSAVSQPPESVKNGATEKPRVKRPNYNQIHSKSLPLQIHPLPAFIPHNPISIVRIAIALLSHSIWPPNSHQIIHKAYYSYETQSVHVTDPKAIRALWEQGFWGSGSLSRSEPRWLDQEKKKRGLEAAATSEEFTRARREERRQFKLERARAQREVIEHQLREEGKLDAETNIDELVENGSVSESPKGTLYSMEGASPLKETADVLGEATNANGASVLEAVSKTITEGAPSFNIELKDQEHLQLTFEEAFFLTYVLGALEIYHNSRPLSPMLLLAYFSLHSTFPTLEYASDTLPPIDPSNTFLLKYIVFHHFRSLGWVVRPGIKFACDYLLYLRGPAFHHAEFAIIIIPSYSHLYWSETPERMKECQEKARKDWWWLHRVNRVQTQVHKTLMLVYVEIPPPWDSDEVDVGSVLKKYTVREFVLRRWSPNRNRD